ncbi:MAG: hypothetical protein EPO08_21315 [Rhodospirillaceae bacterium]|nr:MAG: hypothetical protein EPO08_21315 [Rhodospirillaceae bacterium]
MPGEDARWYERFSRYLALGAARSVRAVYNAELAIRGKPSEQSKAVPSSWSLASHRFDWQRRANAYDEWRRKAVFSSGNAQDTERVKKLDALAERMHRAILDNLDTMPVNDRYIAAYMSIMDMLSKLTGGYAPQRLEHTGKDGKAIEIEETKLSVVFYVPEVDKVELSDSADTGEAGEVPGGDSA